MHWLSMKYMETIPNIHCRLKLVKRTLAIMWILNNCQKVTVQTKCQLGTILISTNVTVHKELIFNAWG